MAVRWQITRGTLGGIERAQAADRDLVDLLIREAKQKRATLWITLEDRYRGHKEVVYARKGKEPPPWWL